MWYELVAYFEIEHQFNWMAIEMHSDFQCHKLVQGATTNECLDGVATQDM